MIPAWKNVQRILRARHSDNIFVKYIANASGFAPLLRPALALQNVCHFTQKIDGQRL